MYKCSETRMADKIKTFAKFGDAGHGGITRYSLSPEAHQARDEFVKRMKAIGAEIETDDIANVYATIPGSDPSAKRIVMGSHADSVRNGGNYDGILGVMGAMEVLETVVKEKIPHKHPLTAMIWTNEEGSLYPPAMFSSGIVCNDYLPPEIAKNFQFDNLMKSKGIVANTVTSDYLIKEKINEAPVYEEGTFGEALLASPYRGEKKNRLSRDSYLCDFELHIEQGPILEDNDKELGVVQCVLGMFNYRISFAGQSAHAGTFPMNKRKDALFAASQAICYLHQEIDKLGRPELVYTTGEITCHPCVHTVIPDFVDFSIDVRHKDPELLKSVMDIIRTLPEKEWAGCKCEIKEQWKRDTVQFDSRLINWVEESCNELGISHQDINSGAGHDAQFCAYVIPTTMIFVRTKAGLSHCEDEYASPEDCTAGASVMLNALLKADASLPA
ncbi:MAG: Zn-dependent hydrolase [Anaerovoracaceae bacterium]